MDETILQYEQDFFKVDFCSNIVNIENRLCRDFIEYGRSGNKLDRSTVIKSLMKLQKDRPIEISRFEVKVLHENLLLVHYISHEAISDVYARRTSIWKKEDDLWKMFFHQGTPCSRPL